MGKRVFLFFALVLVNLSLSANQKSDSLQVLFIGNSYTYYHEMYNMVREIAAHVGQDQKIAISPTVFAPGGCTLKRHLQNGELMKAIERGNWDYVILQEQSTAPAGPTRVVAENTYLDAVRLDSIVKRYNPDAKVIFYMTWGHKYGTLHPIKNYPIIDTYEGMQRRLATSYLEMAYENDAWCAPVGLAWMRVRKERPYTTLYWPDGFHPSKAGSYLAANVIYTTIVQCPYQSSYFAGLDAELAEYLQQVAQQTVLDNLQLLNIAR
ncbi:MAG: SGNH/GDSL hydrolase family protein [Muribaculum sp.]